MNLVDLAAAVIVLLAAALGYRIGLVRQLGGLLGATLGIGLVILAIQSLSAELAQLGDLGRVLGVVAALLVAGFAGQAIGSQIGSRIASGNEEGFGGTTNRWAGALLGGAEGVVLVWLLSSLITVVPDPGLARMAQKSTTVQTLTEIAPAPAALAQQFTDSLAGVDFGLLFDGVIPQPADQIRTPLRLLKAAVQRHSRAYVSSCVTMEIAAVPARIISVKCWISLISTFPCFSSRIFYYISLRTGDNP